MITQLKIEGRLAQEGKDEFERICIDGDPLAAYLPPLSRNEQVVIIDRVVKRSGDRYRDAQGFFEVGNRALEKDIIEANEKHEKDPENEPFYSYHHIYKDWGKVTITVEFEHG